MNDPMESGGVGLKKRAVVGVFLPVIFACSLISPAMCLAGVTPYLASRTGWAMASAMFIAGVLNFFWAVSYTDMVKIYPKCGSHYTYVRNGLGPKIGFFVGGSVLPVYIFACGAHVMVFGWNLRSWLPQVPFWVIAVCYMTFVCLLSIRGISLTSWVAAGMFLTESTIILALALTAIGVTWPEFISMVPRFVMPESPFTWGSVMFAAVLSVYNYIGFAAETSLVEESSPQEVSRSIYWSIVITMFVYVFALIGFPLAWQDAGEIAATQTPLIDAARYFWGALWPVGLLAVLLSTCTCSLACINTGARMLYDMARDGVVPKWLGLIHRKYQTPWAALVFSAIFYLVAAFLIPYVVQVEMIVIVMLLTYAAVAVSNIRTGRPLQGPWAVVRSRVMPAIGIAMSVYLMATASRTAWVWSLAWFLLVGVYELYVWKVRPHSLRQLELTEM